jgi:hypothetical protein
VKAELKSQKENKMDFGDVLYFFVELFIFGIQVVEDHKRKY